VSLRKKERERQRQDSYNFYCSILKKKEGRRKERERGRVLNLNIILEVGNSQYYLGLYSKPTYSYYCFGCTMFSMCPL
jgi:hypothetical protein